MILDDLVAALKPRGMTVEGDFRVRGGISSVVRASYEAPRGAAGSSGEGRSRSSPAASWRARRPQDAVAAGERLQATRDQRHLRPAGRGRPRPRGRAPQRRGQQGRCCASSRRGVERNISIKLTSMGLDISRRLLPGATRRASSTWPARSAASCASTWRARSTPSARSTSSTSCASATTTSASCCRPTCTAREDDVKEAVAARGPRAALQGRLQGAAGASRSRTWTTSAQASRQCARPAARTAELPGDRHPRRGAGPATCSATRASRRSAASASSSRCSTACGRGAGTSWSRRATTCASTCPTARTGSRTSTAACASARRTCFFVLREPVRRLAVKAAVYRGQGDLRVEDVPVPELGPGEMLVRVDACGVCGTDLKKIEKGLLPGPARLRPRDRRDAWRGWAAGVTPLPRGRARGRPPPHPVRRLLLLRARAPTRSARPTRGTAPPRASSPRAAASPSTCGRCDWIVERGDDPGARRRASPRRPPSSSPSTPA